MKFLRRVFALIFVMAGLAALPAHAIECRGMSDSPVLNAQRQLQNASRLAAHSHDPEVVEPATAVGILALKQALTDTTDALMACALEAVDSADISRALSGMFNVRSASQESPADIPPEGNVRAVVVEFEPGNGGAVAPMVLVHIVLEINCGTDSILLGYVRKKGHWVRVVRWQSAKYASIDGAFAGPFQYTRLLNGTLAVVHGRAWCSSRFSMFGIDVIAPSAAAQLANEKTPANGFHFDHGYLIGDDAPRLKRTTDGFEFRATVASIDSDLMQKPGIFRFRVDGDTITRVQPIANHGRDFVDEWLQVDEAFARSLTAQGAAESAIGERARFLAEARKRQLGMSYGAVRACSGTKLFQTEVQLNTDDPAKASLHYARIRQASNGFTLISFSTTADSSCRGVDLMARRRP
jgi:hypothetical protein